MKGPTAAPVLTLAAALAFVGWPGADAPGGEGLEVFGAHDLVADEAAFQGDTLAYFLSRPVLDRAREGALLSGLAAASALRDRAPGEAAAALDALLADHPALGDWRPLLVAAFRSDAGDTAGTRASVEELTPAWRTRWGWSLLIAAHEEAGDLASARAVAEEAAAREETASARAGHWVRAAEFSLQLGDTARAVGDLWTAMLLARRSGAARDAARILDRIAGPLDADQEIEIGLALLSGNEWARAHARLRPHLDDGAIGGEEADRVRASLGRGLVEIRRYADAEALLRPLLRTAEGSPGSASGAYQEALFWTARAALSRGAVAAAADPIWRLAEVAPQSSLASDALALLLEEEVKTGFGPRARAILERMLEIGVRTTAAENVIVKVGTSAYLGGDLATSTSTFTRLAEATGRAAVRQQAFYWAALSAERAGDEAAARRHWRQAQAISPFSYYGLTAAERTDAPVLSLDLPAGPARSDRFDDPIANALLRLRVLRTVGIPGTFEHELERLRSHFLAVGGAYEFGEALADGGFAYEASGTGWSIQAQGGGWNLRLLRLIHPFPYREEVVAQARSRGLDPFLVAGLIRQESVFHPSIVSAAGAVGLMQLMPATAREVASGLRMEFAPALLSEPETNIRLGTTYLAQMLRRFDGRVEDALAAYNAGPGRAAQWRQTPEYRDTDVFVEWIPFEQTRNYVKLVQQHARMYTALYGCGDFDPCLGVTYRDALAMSPFTGNDGGAGGGG